MWIYNQSTGKLFHNNNYAGTGYSGHGNDKNKHESQNIKSSGPCPVGIYYIGVAYDDAKHGPISMRLTPDKDNEMFDRDGFMIHPDSIEHPGEASLGCIALAKDIRIQLRDSEDKKLVVVK